MTSTLTRRRSRIAVLAAVLALSVPLGAAGTVVATSSVITTGLTKYTITWTATAGGAVSANPVTIKRGTIEAIKIVPGTGTAPTALYDVSLVDTDGVDVLNGQGVDQSATVGKYFTFATPLVIDGTQTLDLVIANAGNGGQGVVYIWIRG